MDIYDFLDAYWDGKKKRFFVPAEYIEDGYVEMRNGQYVLCFSTNEGDFEIELDHDATDLAIRPHFKGWKKLELADEDIKFSISNFDDGYGDLGISAVNLLFYLDNSFSDRPLQVKTFAYC